MITTRFAPSPTGFLHVGNLRTAVMNWVLARQKPGGKFILRIDDTDAERSEQRYVDAIRRDLEWLGLTWDREEHQSARLERYMAAAEVLRAAGRLYDCFETPLELDLKRKKQLNMGQPPVYDRAALDLTEADKARLIADGRRPHQRFLLDHREIPFTDLIQGDQRIMAASLSDPVLFREDGQLLYSLASVVDDIEFCVTHVVLRASFPADRPAGRGAVEAAGHTGAVGFARGGGGTTGAGLLHGAAGVLASRRADDFAGPGRGRVRYPQFRQVADQIRRAGIAPAQRQDPARTAL
jgi:glutamyl-tRNA synthetase